MLEFFLSICSFILTPGCLYANVGTNVNNNEVSVKGSELEIFDLNKGFDRANVIIDKDVEINIDNKYYIYSSRIEKPNDENIVKNGKVYFTGNPVITGDNLRVDANSFVFDIKSKRLSILGEVKCTYKDIIFNTDSCEFDARKNIFSFNKNGTLNVRSVVLKSKIGRFNLNDNKFVLMGNASIDIDNYTLKCETIEITDDVIKCTGNVKLTVKDKNIIVTTKNDVLITDKNNIIKLSKCLATSDEFILYGEDVIVNRESTSINITNGIEILSKSNYYITALNLYFNYYSNRGSINGNNLIELKFDDNLLNMYVASENIDFNLIKPKDEHIEGDALDKFNIYSYGNAEYFSKDDNETNSELNKVNKDELSAYNNSRGIFLKGSSFELNVTGGVELWSKNLKIKSESFNYKNSKIEFNEKLSIWQGKNKLTSNKATVYFENGIKKVILTDRPFIALLKNIFPSQIKSDEIYMDFKNNKLIKILFNKNVETLLYIFYKSELKYINNLKTNSLCILFDNDLNPIKALFNKNSGRIITYNDISKNSDILFMDRYNDLSDDIPQFDNIARRIVKKSNIPISVKMKFLNKKIA